MLLRPRLANWNYLRMQSKSYLHLDGFTEKKKKKKSHVYSFTFVPENTEKIQRGLLRGFTIELQEPRLLWQEAPETGSRVLFLRALNPTST